MRMPRYDIRNDGVGPYATFYCDKCYREFRSQADIGNTIANNVGKAALGGFLRNIPVVGYAAANSVQDSRYSTNLTPQQLDAAWQQVAQHFHECPVCQMVVCPSDWDAQSEHCTEDSPRRAEIAQAQAEQAAGIAKGFATAFGLGGALGGIGQAAQAAAQAGLAHCSQCHAPAAAGTKFCPRCGGAMVQPAAVAAAAVCPDCGRQMPPGTAFCTNCGAKIPAPAAAPQGATCPNCGASVAGRFCGACGAKVS
jgi:hypothetical protein